MDLKAIFKALKGILLIILIVILLYTLLNGIITFYRGYHNLDLAYNFINLGYEQDISLKGQLVSLKDYYLIGLNQMLWGFKWICFDLILAIVAGYLLKGELKNE